MRPDFGIVASYDVPPFGSGREGWGIAVDIGTTTVVMELASPEGTLARVSFLNGQSRWGTDVLSRVRAAGLGHAGDLRSLILSDLADGMARLLSAARLVPEDLGAVTVAANTAMCHFLLGLPAEGLGAAPFTPWTTVYPETTIGALFGATVPVNGTDSPLLRSSCPVRIVPGIGAFIGGDIVSGLAALGLEGREGPELFIDLGTNAEMVLVADGRYRCASASAGPAFEGGSITCGTGSVPGAVESVRLEGGRFAWTLIGEESAPDARFCPGGQPAGGALSAVGARSVDGALFADGSRRAGKRRKPVGLCGSGIIDFLACALEAGLVGTDGSLAPVCAESGVFLDGAGTIKLTASDVRSLEVAKAAIRAGIDTLVLTSGYTPGDIVKVHLAGGFGLHLDERNAFAIGLLPRAFAGIIHRAGNTSLAGAARYLSEPSLASRFDAIIKASDTVQLADSAVFSRLFIDFMEFN